MDVPKATPKTFFSLVTFGIILKNQFSLIINSLPNIDF